MKLTNKIVEQMQKVSGNYARLRAVFEGFSRDAVLLITDEFIKGVTIETDLDQLELVAKFAATKIKFKMFPGYGTSYKLNGNVFVTRESHRLTNDIDTLGTFVVDLDGMTDIEDTGPDDCYSLPYAARGIVLHFLHEAIAKPVQ